MPQLAPALPPIRLAPSSGGKEENSSTTPAPVPPLQPSALPFSSSSPIGSVWMIKRSPEDFPPTPRAPTPYRPGRVTLRAKRSVLPSLFEMKLDVPRRRSSEYRTMLEAARRMEERYRESLPKKACKRLMRLTDTDEGSLLTDGKAADALGVLPPIAAERNPCLAQEEYSSVDQAMRECFLLEAIEEQVAREEAAGRVFIQAEENYYYTTLLVDGAHSLMEALAENDDAIIRDVRHAAALREEERNNYFHDIAERIHERFHQKRLKEKINAAAEEQLSLYTASLGEIHSKQISAWQELMVWHAKRMRGYGLVAQAATEKRDYRITKKTKKTRRKERKRAGHVEKEGSTERTLRVLKEKKSGDKQLVLFNEADAREKFREALYAAMGQKSYQREKERKTCQARLSRRFVCLEEEELEARKELQQLESQQWIPLMLFGIDGYYEAKQATRDRVEMEELLAKKEAGDALARAEVKRRLLAKEFSERNDAERATSSPWTPDVIAY